MNNDTNEIILQEILKNISLLIEYLVNTKFEMFEAECYRQDLIQYLYNNLGFYSQNLKKITSSEFDYMKINYMLEIISSNYKSACNYIPQRVLTTDALGKKLTDFDFYVAIRTKVKDNCEPITMELNDIINYKNNSPKR